MHELIYLMQSIHEAIDSGNCSVRIFFADFSKGFDIIDHSILLSMNSDLLASIKLCFVGYAPFLPTEHERRPTRINASLLAPQIMTRSIPLQKHYNNEKTKESK